MTTKFSRIERHDTFNLRKLSSNGRWVIYLGTKRCNSNPVSTLKIARKLTARFKHNVSFMQKVVTDLAKQQGVHICSNRRYEEHRKFRLTLVDGETAKDFRLQVMARHSGLLSSPVPQKHSVYFQLRGY